jgi:hypothetical protein
VWNCSLHHSPCLDFKQQNMARVRVFSVICKCVQTEFARKSVYSVIANHDVNMKSSDHIYVKIFTLWTLVISTLAFHVHIYVKIFILWTPVISTLANEWAKFLSPSPNLA